MALSKCARCSKLFNKGGSPVCPACQPDEDTDFDTIRRVLTELPDSNAEQLAARAGLPLAVVMRMLDQGLIASADSHQIKCGRCGAPAISAAKKLCQACLETLNAQVATAQMTIKLPEKKPADIASVRKVIQEKRKTNQ
jgi:ribosomal protein L37E